MATTPMWLGLQLGAFLAGQVSLSVQGPEGAAGDPRLRAGIALRLVDEGYRVVPSPEDAEVELTVRAEGADLLLEALGPRVRGRTRVEAADAGVGWLEALQRVVVLVEGVGGRLDLDTEGIPRGVRLLITGPADDRRLAITEELALALLDSGYALTPAPLPGDLVLCVQVGDEEGAVRVGEGSCGRIGFSAPPEPAALVDAMHRALRAEESERPRAPPEVPFLPRARPGSESGPHKRWHDLQLRMSGGLGTIATGSADLEQVGYSLQPTARLDVSVGLRDGPALWGSVGGDTTSFFAHLGPAGDLSITRFLDLRVGTLLGTSLGYDAVPVPVPTLSWVGMSVELPVTLSAVFLSEEISLTAFARHRVGLSVGHGLQPRMRAEVGLVLSIGVNFAPSVFAMDLIGKRQGTWGVSRGAGS